MTIFTGSPILIQSPSYFREHSTVHVPTSSPRVRVKTRARVRVRPGTSLVITESMTRIKSPSYPRENSATHVLT